MNYSDVAKSKGLTPVYPGLPVVCIQGLGFVGVAMAVAVASSVDAERRPQFNVIGVDLPTREGEERVSAVNSGTFPFRNTDRRMLTEFDRVHRQGLLVATTEPKVFSLAEVALVSVNLDLQGAVEDPVVDLKGFRRAVRSLGSLLPEGSLIIVETTVPPGTCERVVVPEVTDVLAERGLPPDAILIAHSYERVMPGHQYLESIVDFWRVYAGHTERAADLCGIFLSRVINVQDFPLTRLRSMTASETAKVLENSYRAVTIAFMEEWGRFAEAAGIDMFEIVEAIRKRPTHNNIRQPGFGVGGYCLTKDPLFAKVAARDLFGLTGMGFPFCEQAVALNNQMPLVSLKYIEERFGGDLAGRSILLLGVSYRQDVGDTRYSPSFVFAQEAVRRGARVVACDPLLDEWPEMGMEVLRTPPPAFGFDAVVFAVGHKEFTEMDITGWLAGCSPLLFDANAVLPTEMLLDLKRVGHTVQSIGRGIL